MENYLELLDDIRKQGRIVFVKLDGERDSNFYTLVIDYPRPTMAKAIRVEGQNLEEVLKSGIEQYQERHS